MDERQFDSLAAAQMAAIEKALEACEAELDFELKPGGVIEIGFDDGSKIIVNSHRAAREIWVAARSGGYHFRPEGERWIGTRGNEELMKCLARCIGEQAGVTVRF